MLKLFYLNGNIENAIIVCTDDVMVQLCTKVWPDTGLWNLWNISKYLKVKKVVTSQISIRHVRISQVKLILNLAPKVTLSKILSSFRSVKNGFVVFSFECWFHIYLIMILLEVSYIFNGLGNYIFLLVSKL